jgi:hypothetical protein
MYCSSKIHTVVDSKNDLRISQGAAGSQKSQDFFLESSSPMSHTHGTVWISTKIRYRDAYGGMISLLPTKEPDNSINSSGVVLLLRKTTYLGAIGRSPNNTDFQISFALQPVILDHVFCQQDGIFWFRWHPKPDDLRIHARRGANYKCFGIIPSYQSIMRKRAVLSEIGKVPLDV